MLLCFVLIKCRQVIHFDMPMSLPDLSQLPLNERSVRPFRLQQLRVRPLLNHPPLRDPASTTPPPHPYLDRDSSIANRFGHGGHQSGQPGLRKR